MTYTRYRPSWRDEVDPFHPAAGATAMDAGFCTKIEDSFTSQDTRITTLETGGTGVPTSRHINTDSTMSGGGDLTTDRTLSVSPNTTNQKLQIAKSGTLTGTRKQLNFIPGTNVTITTADNSSTDAVDVTINSSSSGSSGIPASTVTAKGDIIAATASAAVTNVPVGTNNSILCADSTQTPGLGWKALSTILQAILTTKGDLLTSNSSAALRLPVGTNNQVLTADSTQTSGLKWSTPILPSIVTNQGSLAVGNGSGPVELGSTFVDGQVLTVNSGASLGIGWATPPASVTTVQDHTLSLAQQSTINFTGNGVKSTNNSGQSRTDVTIPGETNPIASDHNLAAWAFDPASVVSASSAINGTVYLIKIKILSTVSITKIYFNLAAAGVTPTTAQNYAGIYNSSGTLLTSVDVSSSITTLGLQTATITSTSISSPFIWVGLVFNCATPPSVSRGASAATLINVGLTAANYRFANASVTGQTSLPTPLTVASNTTNANAYWAAVA